MTKSTIKENTPRTFLYTLSIIHIGLVAGALFFGLFIYLNGNGFSIGFSGGASIFTYIVPLIAIAAYFGSNYLFNKQLNAIIQLKSLKDKLISYLQACLARYAFIESAAFLGMFVFIWDNQIFYLVISLLLMFYLLKLRPNKVKVIQDLKLDMEDEQRFLRENEELK